MYLHAGNNKNLRTKNVIGIFDADTATVSPVTKKYIAGAQAEGRVEFASVELPKSFVVYRKEPPRQERARSGFRQKKRKPAPKSEVRVCFSQLSPASLAGRAENKKNRI